MTDPSFALRTGTTGEQVEGTPGNVLTFQSDGTVRGEAPAAGGSAPPFGLLTYNFRAGTIVFVAASELTRGACADAVCTYAGHADFVAPDATKALLRYVGADPVTVQVRAVAGFQNEFIGFSVTVSIAVALNGDLVGELPDSAVALLGGALPQIQVNDYKGEAFHSVRLVTLANGDELELLLGTEQTDLTWDLFACSLSVQVVSGA